MLAVRDIPIGAAAFKQAMRSLVSGVTVVAAQDRQGACVGLTATAVTSLSADPPSLLVSVNRASAMAPALVRGTLFSVNVLAADQVDVAEAFGGQRGLRGTGKFAYGHWYRSVSGTPLLAGSVVTFECTVSEMADFATHRVVMGAVLDVHVERAGAAALAYRDARYVSVE